MPCNISIFTTANYYLLAIIHHICLQSSVVNNIWKHAKIIFLCFIKIYFMPLINRFVINWRCLTGSNLRQFLFLLSTMRKPWTVMSDGPCWGPWCWCSYGWYSDWVSLLKWWLQHTFLRLVRVRKGNVYKPPTRLPRSSEILTCTFHKEKNYRWKVCKESRNKALAF